MKRLGGLCLFLTLTYLQATSLYSQQTVPTFFLTDHSVQQGEEFIAQVKVTDFQSILGVQFSIEWDSTMIKFVEVSSFPDAFDLEQDFGYPPDLASNVLSFRWFDPALKGISMADSTLFFSITFEVIGDSSPNTTIAFSDTPTDRLIVNASEEVLEAQYFSGEVMIDGLSTSIEQIDLPFSQNSTFYPNPFKDYTQIEFDLTKSTTVTMNIFDSHGHEIFREDRPLDSGKQLLSLDERLFPQSGIYYCKVLASGFSVTHRLVFLTQ